MATGPSAPYDKVTNPTGYKPGTIEEKKARQAAVPPVVANKATANNAKVITSAVDKATADKAAADKAAADKAASDKAAADKLNTLPIDQTTGQPVDDANLIYNGKSTTLVGLYSDAMNSVSRLKQVKDLLITNGQLKASKSGTISKQTVLNEWLKVLIGASQGYAAQKATGITPTYDIGTYLKELKSAGFGVDTTGSTSATPNVTVTSQASATADINDAFQGMFGDSVPKDVSAAYYKELNALEMSRTSKPKTAKGVDIYTAGVSQQERQDILNKYLAQYATVKINNANTGDTAAVASLNKGTFGVTYTTLRNAYANNGIPINAKSLAQQVTESAFSKDKLDSNLNLINLQAATYFPALADKIGQGYSVKQLLTPYLNTRANILEEDPDTIDISKLTGVAKDSKSLMGLYDYEVSLRNDPKWRFTKNAQDSMSSVAQGLAKTFGLVG